MSLYTRNSLSVVSQLRSNLPNLRSYNPGPRTQFSLAQVPLEIISSATIADEFYRWEYTVKVTTMAKDTLEFTPKSIEDFPIAYNGWEAANTETSVAVLSGDDPADLPTGFTVDPLPNGLVCMGFAQYFTDCDGDEQPVAAYYLISEPNPIAGECT